MRLEAREGEHVYEPASAIQGEHGDEDVPEEKHELRTGEARALSRQRPQLQTSVRIRNGTANEPSFHEPCLTKRVVHGARPWAVMGARAPA